MANNDDLIANFQSKCQSWFLFNWMLSISMWKMVVLLRKSCLRQLLSRFDNQMWMWKKWSCWKCKPSYQEKTSDRHMAKMLIWDSWMSTKCPFTVYIWLEIAHQVDNVTWLKFIFILVENWSRLKILRLEILKLISVQIVNICIGIIPDLVSTLKFGFL